MTEQMDRTGRILIKALASSLEGRLLEDPGLSEKEWEEVMSLAALQSVLPLVFESVWPLLPEQLEKRCRAEVLTLVTGQVRAFEEFAGVYRALSEKGIRPLVFKGAVCRSLYPQPDFRVSADEDIYVRQEDYMELHRALQDLGFTCTEPSFRSAHETLYRGRDLMIEGHWQLFPEESALYGEMNSLSEGILSRAEEMEIEGTAFLVPEPTDHMIYLLLHAMKHFVLAGVGIRQICDIALWGRRYSIDWDRVRDTVSSLGGLTFTEALLDAAAACFDMPLPRGFEKRDSSRLVLDALKGGTFGGSSRDRWNSASLTMAGGDGALPLLKAVFPSRTVMEVLYPWVRKSPLLVPVSWGVRLFGYAKRIGKEASPLNSIRIGRERSALLKEYGISRQRGTFPYGENKRRNE